MLTHFGRSSRFALASATKPDLILPVIWSRWNDRWRQGSRSRISIARARLLRGYTVHEVLGEGAFGRVFAATQPGTNREVAIKAIRPDLSNSAEFIQRFEAEAQLVARLEHPHIVPLYDYWREPGGAYLVFRLLLGGTAFAAMVNDGPFSVARVSRVVEEVGSALLARAHGRSRPLRHQTVERDVRRDRQRVPLGLRHRRHDVDESVEVANEHAPTPLRS